MMNFFAIALLFSGSSVLGQSTVATTDVSISTTGVSAVATGSASSSVSATPTPSECLCNDAPPQAAEGQ